MKKKRVFVVPWNYDPARSLAAVRTVYPEREIIFLEKRKLRRIGFLKQLFYLRQFKGEAFVFFFRSIEELNAPLLLAWIGLLHRCPATVLLDESGNKKIYTWRSWFHLAPLTAIAVICDVLTLLCSFAVLRTGLRWRRRAAMRTSGTELNLAYLFPYPMARMGVGGAMSHVQGFLDGVRQNGVPCRVFTGRPLPFHDLSQDCSPLSSMPFLFWEAAALAYNWHFVRKTGKALSKSRPRALYQRHGRFVVAGALLSKKLRVPLVLEYNGSEIWTAKNWDPSRFGAWLQLCEDYALKSASFIVVVSEVLRQELVTRGIEKERILVNANAVDPQVFRPSQNRGRTRDELGLAPDDIVACFIGTFSYWHGIEVLQKTARRLLGDSGGGIAARVRFLLIGDGPLRAEIETALSPWVKDGRVIFTGPIPHDRVPGILDAADIFLAPLIPFADGSEFFGSPTKLFEYMAMEKAIIASNLGQMGTILTHKENGWLTEPGNAEALGAAILYLAEHADMRLQMGQRAREAAISRHTWRQNAQAVLASIQDNFAIQCSPRPEQSSTNSADAAMSGIGSKTIHEKN
jgi:glycosyltransferase involved in cell wall biosynthesis